MDEVARGLGRKNDRDRPFALALGSRHLPIAALEEVGTVVRPDLDPSQLQQRPEILVDPGIGRTGPFGVRTAEESPLELLQRDRDNRFGGVVDVAGSSFVANSPIRVVVAPLGRADVDGATPVPGDGSPRGSHSRLLLEQLAGGEDGPTDPALPSDTCPTPPLGSVAGATARFHHARPATGALVVGS